MGSIIEYKCAECGYETRVFAGVSGKRLWYSIPYICENKKEIVLIRGDGAVNKPAEHPDCPECSNHKLNERWNYIVCPRCSRNNDYEAVGLWD